MRSVKWAPIQSNCCSCKKRRLGHTQSRRDCVCRDPVRTCQQEGGHLRANERTSLVVPVLRICLPVQGIQVGSLVWEDPTCHRAPKPVSHSYWSCAPRAHAATREAIAMRGPYTTAGEPPCSATKTPSAKIIMTRANEKGLRRNQYWRYLHLRFLGSRTMKNTFMFFKPPSRILCYGSPGRLIQMKS